MADSPEKATPAGTTPPSPPAAAAPATAAAAAVAPKPAVPGAPAAAVPLKPRPKVQLVWEPKELRRRDWWLVSAWMLFAVASTIATLFYVLRFLFPNMTYEPPLQFKAGPPHQFAPGRVDEGFKPNRTWIGRDDR